MDILITRCQKIVRWLYDCILISIHPWNYIRRDRTYMCSDHVRQTSPRRLERRTVC
jgi:hypothetical protein